MYVRFLTLSIFLNVIIIGLIYGFEGDPSFKSWEAICSILSCQSVLDQCIRYNCIGLNQCRSCVQTENQICVRCVDSVINQQYITINGTQTIECDEENPLHETICNFNCRLKEKPNWKCEKIKDNQVCYCFENDLMTTMSPTITLQTDPIKPIGSLLGNYNFYQLALSCYL
jgi:hypothetical protein